MRRALSATHATFRNGLRLQPLSTTPNISHAVGAAGQTKNTEVSNESVLPNYEASLNKGLHTIPLSLTTANQKEKTSYKIRSALHKFQLHDSDCGSASVQVAVMTEKISNLARHFAQHKKDKHGWRGFQMLISRRKQMLIYLKRSDFAKFRETVFALNLQKEVASLR